MSEWDGVNATVGRIVRKHEALVSKLAVANAEIERLKGILRDVVTAAGGLAAPGVSVEFLSHAPAEVAGQIERLKAEMVRVKIRAGKAFDDVETLTRELATSLKSKGWTPVQSQLIESGTVTQIRTALRETREALAPIWGRVEKPKRTPDGRFLSARTQGVMIQASEIERIEAVLARYAHLAGEADHEN